MKTLRMVREEKQTAVDNLINSCGVFFAFSDDQFKKGKAKAGLKDGEKLVSIGCGGYMPESNIDTFKDGLEAIEETFNKDLKEYDLRNDLIAYELSNHEAYYTGDITSTVLALGKDFTREEVMEVYKQRRGEFAF